MVDDFYKHIDMPDKRALLMLLGAYAYFWYSGDWLKSTAGYRDWIKRNWRDKTPPPMPVLGQYDNTYGSNVVDEHMAQARRGGIDFLAVSWEASRDVEHAFDAAARAGIKATAHYESLTRAGRKRHNLLPDDMPAVEADLEILGRDAAAQRDAWLRVDGRPAFMIYVTRCYESAQMIDAMRAALERGCGEGVFLVGDELWWKPLDPDRIRRLDAVTAYNMYLPQKIDPASPVDSYLSSVREMMARHSAACEEAGVALWASAMPGYDDSGYRPQAQHPPLPRGDGDFFRRSLRDARDAARGDPGCVVITSWNEHYEMSGIEPYESYGDLYLDITRGFLH